MMDMLSQVIRQVIRLYVKKSRKQSFCVTKKSENPENCKEAIEYNMANLSAENYL